VLCFDRTQWQFGQTTDNVLMLAVAFPLLWVLLPKRGNSNTAERIDLVARLLKLFPRKQIAYLTADREFIGREWLKYLLKQPVPFRIRICQSERLGNGRGKAIMRQRTVCRLATRADARSPQTPPLVGLLGLCGCFA